MSDVPLNSIYVGTLVHIKIKDRRKIIICFIARTRVIELKD